MTISKLFRENLYWLKGGLISVGIAILLVLIIGFIFSFFSGGQCTELCSLDVCEKSFKVCFQTSLLIVSIPVALFNSIIDFRISANDLIPFMTVILGFYFVVGSIIGIIIKKMK